jgi:SAM-dependent methyltransferase
MDLSSFGNPWEHIRLLSDARRNSDLIAMLERHARNRRVLEVGCGTGLLSCIAARLGAEHVYGVEPTEMVDVARELVRRNRLENKVTILEGMVQDVERTEVDLVFSELLNADPFIEGVVPAMHAASKWLVPGGILSPRRLKVFVALARAPGNAREARSAHAQVKYFEEQHGLDLSAVAELMTPREPYKFYTSSDVAPVSTAALAWDMMLGGDLEAPDDVIEVTVKVTEPGPVAGAVVWFEAELDEHDVMHNRPGELSHWGQLVHGWAFEYGMAVGTEVSLRLELDDDELEVTIE